MTLNIDKRKCEISDSVLEASKKKIAKLDRFFKEDAEINLKFSEVRGQSVVEITVRSAHMYFRAEERSGDTVAAVDSATDTIIRQMRKNKTRLEKKLRDGAFERTIGEQVSPTELQMVRRKYFELKPMTEDEAILQMEMLDHKFYLFKNSAEQNRVCVVYSREDGGYGVIISE